VRPRLTATDGFALARMLLTALDTLSEEMTAAYAATDQDLAADRDRATAPAARRPDRRTPTPRWARLADRSARLGVQLPDPYCLLVAEPAGAERPDMAQDAATGLLNALAAPGDEGHVGGDGTGLPRGPVCCRPPPLPGRERRWGAREWRGCAITGESLDRVAVAHRLAADALDTAPAPRPSGRARPHRRGRPCPRAARRASGPRAGARRAPRPRGRSPTRGSATSWRRSPHISRRARRTPPPANCTSTPSRCATGCARIHDLTSRDPRDPWQRLTLDIARTIGP